jgi:RNA polymerase-binding transcription factor DksA|tara:strand:+ start:3101 stop:3472 length:372 start_codon:yes stop_codon:yes gene_type:complete
MAEIVRYSDAELMEFKQLIEDKIESSERDLKHFQGQIDFSANDSGTTVNIMEEGSEALSREKIAQMAHRQRKFIQQLKAALVRIQNKSYGVCRSTGKLIRKERLKIVPHTTLSIEAKNLEARD